MNLTSPAKPFPTTLLNSVSVIVISAPSRIVSDLLSFVFVGIAKLNKRTVKLNRLSLSEVGNGDRKSLKCDVHTWLPGKRCLPSVIEV